MQPANLSFPRAGSGFDDIALPLQPQAVSGSAADGASFSSAYGSLRAEILGSIENGFGSAAAPSATVPSMASYGTSADSWLASYQASGAKSIEPASGGSTDASRRAFLDKIAPWAMQAAEQLGTSPHIIAAHAALESGWGQQPVKSQGRSVHNLFGIKAGSSWRGSSVDAMTTEYINGADVKMVQRFRAYPDYGSAFRDYTKLLKDNPRYAGAINAGNDARAFGRGLKRGGYATDAAYEEKLVKVARQIQGMNLAVR